MIADKNSFLQGVLAGVRLKSMRASLPFLAFVSTSAFTISVYNGTKNWDGVLEYSVDARSWHSWDGTTAITGTVVCFRGEGNTVITGDRWDSVYQRWKIQGAAVRAIGNIENLLDWKMVSAGKSPHMGEYCFSSLFQLETALTEAPLMPTQELSVGCYRYMYSGTGITSAPELPSKGTLPGSCYDSMFMNCKSLTYSPDLPAESTGSHSCLSMFYGCDALENPPKILAKSLGYYSCEQMFSKCTGLKQVPDLSAVEVFTGSCLRMFSGCTGLETLPKFTAATLYGLCYSYMFSGCSKIKLSETRTAEYSTEYRIPGNWSGTEANNPLLNMFENTGGTFTGTPTINTTYYTSNEIVPAE